MDSNQTDFKYWAFLSYSTKDSDFANKLHRSLETYRVPNDLVGRPGKNGVPVPKRIFPIFKDREELPLSGDISSSIEDALKCSKFLIVLCSETSAQSPWVSKEILYFKKINKADKIFAVIVDGSPDAKGNHELDPVQYLPRALRQRLADHTLEQNEKEPLWGDMRKGSDDKEATFLKMVAGIIGVGYDALAQREAKRQFRRKILLYAVALIVGLSSLYVWGLQQN